MSIDPHLHIDLTLDEIRKVTRFAVVPVEEALARFGDAPDTRVTAAVDAARRFADGEPRTVLQRRTAVDAHRAARIAADAVHSHLAAAAGDAAASAYLHPLARATQVPHILRSTAHVALAAEAASEDADAARTVLDHAVHRASPTLVDVLRRYPVFPPGGTPLARAISELDARLRGL